MQLNKGIIYLSRCIFIVNSIYLMFTGHWNKALLLVVSLVLTFIPEIYTKLTGIKMTSGGRASYTAFILGAQWLGTYLRLYDYLFWWDVLLHFSSGLILGYIALVVLITLDTKRSLIGSQHAAIIALFVFSVSIVGAVLWEIAEYASDSLFHTYTQLGSLQDTMEDLICGTLGALLFALYIGYKLFKKQKSCLDALVSLNVKK